MQYFLTCLVLATSMAQLSSAVPLLGLGDEATATANAIVENGIATADAAAKIVTHDEVVRPIVEPLLLRRGPGPIVRPPICHKPAPVVHVCADAPIHVDAHADLGHLLDARLAASVVADLNALAKVSATAAVSVNDLYGCKGGLLNLGLGTGVAANVANIVDLDAAVATVVGDNGLLHVGGVDGVAAAAASAVAGVDGVAATAVAAVSR